MAEEVLANKKKVMVAIDESECSHYALKWALENLPDCIASSAPLVVFTVQPISNTSFISVTSHGSASLELIKSVQEHRKKISLALLEQAKEICSKHGVVAVTITEVGDPKGIICEAVEKFKIDLLILGNHGRGALQRAFLGSVSNYCMQHAKCPVLVVKKQT
ncbi:universal stress protein A-like protein isoform X2 [Magnolia sinica]|uniref:universal stress protein A-like protein isoform X2 n=1 Tax=Magnolia sinica TaxID=86752 RepID=UPI00265A16D3|nr:universal stress protein A-like protein isoform X2 [Magnolia sinica]